MKALDISDTESTKDSLLITIALVPINVMKKTNSYEYFLPIFYLFFFFSSRRRHTRFDCDWSSDVCSSDLLRRGPRGRRRRLCHRRPAAPPGVGGAGGGRPGPGGRRALGQRVAVAGARRPEVGRASCRGRG